MFPPDSLKLVRFAVLLGLVAGCGGQRVGNDAVRSTPPARPRTFALADTALTLRLEIPPASRVWMGRIVPVPVALIAPPREPIGAAPQPQPAAVPEAPAPSADAELKPPLLRSARPLDQPPGSEGAQVELEVRVEEDGSVSDATWVGGSEQAAVVAAALRCARTLRFYPALRQGRPVAVTCRQRFRFAAR